MIRTIIILCVSILAFSACEEVGPFEKSKSTQYKEITYIADNAETPSVKKVLIEDFTGVRCPNCPGAAKKIHEIDSLNPGRLVAIAIHVFNNFGIPYDAILHDFRTNEGNQIWETLGKGNMPTGPVDRVLFSGQTKLLVGINYWSSYFQERKQVKSPVNLHLTSSFNPIDSTVTVSVRSHYTEAVNDTHYITIAITESNIIHWQMQPTGLIDSHYVHNHVLRRIITIPMGDLLIRNPESKREIIREYNPFKISPLWNPDNCHIIAFIHESGDKFNVLQAEEISLK